MSYRGVKLLSAMCAGGSLLYIYLLFAVAFIQHVDPSGLNLIEQAVLVTQAARLIAVFAVPKLRNAKAEVTWTFFSLETFAVVVLMGFFIYSSDPFYSHLVVNLFSTWVTALLLVTPPYTIFRYVAGMVGTTKLWGVLVSMILEFGFLVFLNNVISEVKGSVDFGNFLTTLITNTRGEIIGGKNPVAVGPGFMEPSIVLYVALLVYAGIPSEYESDLASVLTPALLATMVLLGWISLATTLVPNTLFSLTVPAIALTLLVWWSTNER